MAPASSSQVEARRDGILRFSTSSNPSSPSVPIPHTIDYCVGTFRAKMLSSTQTPWKSLGRDTVRAMTGQGVRSSCSVQAATLFSGDWGWWMPRRESPVSEAKGSPVLVSRIFIERTKYNNGNVVIGLPSVIDGQSQRFLRGTATARARLTINVYPERHAVN